MNKKIRQHFKTPLWWYISLGILVALLRTVNIYFLQNILDHLTAFKDVWWLIGYASTLLILPLVSYLSEYPRSKLRYGLFYFLKKAALDKMRTIDYLSYVQNSSGILLQKIESGAEAGRNIYLEFYCRLLSELFPEAVFNVLFIALLDVRLVPFVLLGYVLVFLLANILLKFLQSLKQSALDDQEALNKILVRGITELLTFRVNRRYRKESQRYGRLAQQMTATASKMTLIHEAFFALFALLVAVLKVVVLVCYFRGVFSLSLGGFVALLTYIDRIYNPIAIFNVLFVQYRLDQAAYQRLLEIYQLPDDPKLEKTAELTAINQIVLKNISFALDQPIIENFSYTFEKGKVYGLIGKSGSGKSTLLKLILGVLPIDQGSILFDQQSLAELDLDSLYAHTMYLSQEAPIFDGSLRENIVFEKNVSEAALKEVLHKCQLADFYRQLPAKLDTAVGERGTRLSGGEKQRVAFARLFFAEAELIILDEATSALDHETASQLLQEAAAVFKNKIVIFVTHKPSELSWVDEIISL